MVTEIPEKGIIPAPVFYVAAVGLFIVVAQAARSIAVGDGITLFEPAVGLMAGLAAISPTRHRLPVAVTGLVGGVLGHHALGAELPYSLLAAVGANLALVIVAGALVPLVRRPRTFGIQASLYWALTCTAAGAAGGLVMATFAQADARFVTAVQWALSRSIALFTVAPLFLIYRRIQTRRSPPLSAELTIVLGVFAVTAGFAAVASAPFLYLTLLLLVWVGMRGGGRWGMPATIGLTGYSTYCAFQGWGPFALETDAGVIQLQLFAASAAFSAAITASWASAGEEARHTAKTQAETIAQSDARWRRIIEASQHGILEVDSDSVISYSSDRMAAMLGIEVDQIVGQTLPDLLGTDTWQRIQERRPPTDSHRNLVFEIGPIDTHQGRTWAVVSVSHLVDQNGERVRSTVFVNDVTELKLAAIERRNREDAIVDAERSEQARLARRLHDGPLQDLTAVHAILGHLAQDEGLKSPEAPRLARNAAAAMTDALASMRSGMNDLDPPDITHGGIGDALRRHAHRIAGPCQVEIKVSEPLIHCDEQLLTADQAYTMYWVGREAIANAIAHADATTLSIERSADSSWHLLTVQDDGSGFDVEQPRQVGHIGLRSMLERAREAHGQLEIRSLAGEGTTVTLRLPRPASASEPTAAPTPE